MSPRRRIVMLPVLVALAALSPGAGPALAIGLGQPAPDFVVENVTTGTGFSMSEHAGKIVVLVFFAHW